VRERETDREREREGGGRERDSDRERDRKRGRGTERERGSTSSREELDGLDSLRVSGELLDTLLGNKAIMLAFICTNTRRGSNPRTPLVISFFGSMES
jgi:hypothetical protein